MRSNLLRLLECEVITLEDLDGFSEALQHDLAWVVKTGHGRMTVET